jgi:3'-5' exonuclease
MSVHDTVMIVDIETVKDREVLPEDWSEKKWPPAIGWQVVTLAMIVVDVQKDENGERFNIKKVTSRAGDEADVLKRFWSYFNTKAPRIVTWNGRGFDLPVLQHRAFIHAVPMPAWFLSGQRWASYRQRFCDEWHNDLMDVMSCHGATAKTAMDLMASSIGLPGKIGGHGSEVQGMYDSGEIEQIQAYCECDVLNLYGLYIRWRHVTGMMSREAHDHAYDNLADYLVAGSSEKTHFEEFLDQWGHKGVSSIAA